MTNGLQQWEQVIVKMESAKERYNDTCIPLYVCLFVI